MLKLSQMITIFLSFLLIKIPALLFFQPFCKLTGYSHEIYVDPEREIYKRLGMKRGEEIASSGKT